MSPNEILRRFPGASPSFIKANLRTGGQEASMLTPAPTPRHPVCVKPTTDEEKLNKTERAYLAMLRSLGLLWIGVQNVTLKLANDCRFTPDFATVDRNGHIRMIDCKGGFWREDAKIKIKFAARQFPFMEFVVAQKTKCGWNEIHIKP